LRLGAIYNWVNKEREKQLLYYERADSLIKNHDIVINRDLRYIHYPLLKSLNRYDDLRSIIINDYNHYVENELFVSAYENILSYKVWVYVQTYSETDYLAIVEMIEKLESKVKGDDWLLLLKIFRWGVDLTNYYSMDDYFSSQSIITDYLNVYSSVLNLDIEEIWDDYLYVGKSLMNHCSFSENYENLQKLIEFIEPLHWNFENDIENDSWFIQFVDETKGHFNDELYNKYMNRILAYDLSEKRIEKKMDYANYFYSINGDYNSSIKLFEEALLEAKELNNNELEIEILLKLGKGYAQNRQKNLSEKRTLEALQLSRHLKNLMSQELALLNILEWLVGSSDEKYYKYAREYLIVCKKRGSHLGHIQALGELIDYFNIQNEPDSLVHYMIEGFELYKKEKENLSLNKYLSFLIHCFKAIHYDKSGLIINPFMAYYNGDTLQPVYIKRIYDEIVFLKDFDYSIIDSTEKFDSPFVYYNNWVSSISLQEYLDDIYLQSEEFDEMLHFLLNVERSVIEWGLINATDYIHSRIKKIGSWPIREPYIGFGFNYNISDGNIIITDVIPNSPSWKKIKRGDLVLLKERFEINRENVINYFSDLVSKNKSSPHTFNIVRNGQELTTSITPDTLQPNPYSPDPKGEIKELIERFYNISDTIFASVDNINNYSSFKKVYREFLITYSWRYFQINGNYTSSDQNIDLLNKYETFSTYGLVYESMRHKEFLNENPLLVDEYNILSGKINDLQLLMQQSTEPTLNQDLMEKRLNLYNDLNYLEKYNLEKSEDSRAVKHFSFKDNFRYFEEFDVIIRFATSTYLKNVSFMWSREKNQMRLMYTNSEKNIATSVKIINQLLSYSAIDTSYENKLEKALIDLFSKINAGSPPPIFTDDYKNKVLKVLVIPEGSMNFLPMELLPVRFESDTSEYYYYGEFANITYAPSLSSYIEFAKRKKGSSKKGSALLVSANPETEYATTYMDNLMALRSDYGNIKYVDNEILNIDKILSKKKLLRRKFKTRTFSSSEITEKKFKLSNLSDYDYIHIAAHGIHDNENPNYSGILLGRNDNDKEDGILQAHEIFPLTLNADLVTLSSCFSGFGEIDPSEGNLGIYRSFLIAGAKSVIISLWNVEDESTSLLFTKFYEHLKDGKSKSESLRLAKMYLKNETRFSAPYFWAPFILIGES
jgi:CHAT domain-containing protein